MTLERRKLVATPDLGATAPAAVPPTGYAFTPYFRQGVWYYKDDTNTEFLVAPAFYGFFGDATGGVALASGVANEVQHVLDTTHVPDANYAILAGELQINSAGTYEVDYTTSISVTNNTAGQRGSFISRLLLDNILVPGSEVPQYYREVTPQSFVTNYSKSFTKCYTQTTKFFV